MKKVLVVDDEKSIRLTFSKFLEKEGFETRTHQNVPEALECIKEFSPDVVVTDIIMPRYSGIDLLKEIQIAAPEIPVIIMTGEPSVDTATDSVRHKAFDYLQKPVNKTELIHIVNQAYKFKKINDEKKELEEENLAHKQNLEKLVIERTGALKQAMQATISTILEIIDFKDPYCVGHNRKVGNLAYDMATRLDLPHKSRNTLLIAGYLHDIGKVAIPSEILSKSRKLTPIEHEIVKSHVQVSFDILSKVDLSLPVAEIVYFHHERLDGSGYPRGIGGGDICTESRVLMIADVVEAMLNHRPYRPAHKIGEVIGELRKNDGTVYDSGITDIVEDMFLKNSYELRGDETEIDFSI